MKGTEGLSELALQMLKMAGEELSKKEKRMLYALRDPATPEEVEGLVLKALAELKSDAPKIPGRERRRLEWLKELNEKADKK